MSRTQTVTVEVNGKVVKGTLTVANEFLTVSLAGACKTTLYRGGRPEHIARQLLRQLALKAREPAQRRGSPSTSSSGGVRWHGSSPPGPRRT